MSDFRKTVEKTQISLKSDNNKRVLYMKTKYILFTSRSILRMKNVPDKSYRENRNKHSMFNNIFFRKSYRLYDNVLICCSVGQATDDRMVHVHCICWIPNATYTHSEYCYSNVGLTLVVRTRLNVTIYVHWLSCFLSVSYEQTPRFINREKYRDVLPAYGYFMAQPETETCIPPIPYDNP
jgi:hypothetical protein